MERERESERQREREKGGVFRLDEFIIIIAAFVLNLLLL